MIASVASRAGDDSHRVAVVQPILTGTRRMCPLRRTLTCRPSRLNSNVLAGIVTDLD